MRAVGRESWRFPIDESLLVELLADDTVKARLATPAYSVAKQARRLGFLANAVLVDPGVLPHLAEAMERVRAEFPDLGATECFVFNCPNINAFICPGRRSTFVGLSSGAVNHLAADELMFVLGHEFGHAAFGHLDLAAGLLVEDPAVGPALTAKVRSWQRAAEITADRTGILVAGSPAAAARALFKVSSGIVATSVETSPERFASQWQRLIEEVIEDGEREHHHFSHPFPPLRMQAILDFWSAYSHSDPTGRLPDANAAVARMLSMMDPVSTERPLGDTMLANHFFWGGLYLAASTGEVSDDERRRLATVAPPDVDIDAAIREAAVAPSACRERFVEGFRSRRRKFNAIELHRVLYGLLDIASVDGSVHEGELTRLRELAGLIDIPEYACDLVVKQYQKENAHEG
jgi:hypothetical protein